VPISQVQIVHGDTDKVQATAIRRLVDKALKS
jgi:hypothetical protein